MDRTTPHIFLASGSPRRLAILRSHGIEPEIFLPAIDEDALVASWAEPLSPEELVKQLALRKARAVYEQVAAAMTGDQSALILAADTVVYKEGIGILGKPTDHSAAVSMLWTLRNSEHSVITGVAGIKMPTGREASFVDVTSVLFGNYSLQEIEDYIALEPPFDKAGSYAIQGMWKKHVLFLKGDLENVIGLPYYRLNELF